MTYRFQLSDLVQLARQLVPLLREARQRRLLVVGAPRQIGDGFLQSFWRLDESRPSEVYISLESVDVGLMGSLKGTTGGEDAVEG